MPDPNLPPDHYAVHADGRAIAFEKDPATGLVEARGASLRGASDLFGVECAGTDDLAQTLLRRFTCYGRRRPLNDELATVPTDAGVRIFYLHTPTTFDWDVKTELHRTSTLHTETGPNGYRPPLAFETWHLPALIRSSRSTWRPARRSKTQKAPSTPK